MTRLISTFLCALALSLNASALDIGDEVPAFSGKDDAGKDWSSSDYIGKDILVVYFYPADMTPGCTKQACNYRDKKDELADRGIKVIGVSGDSVKNHKHFKSAYNLNFPLLADEEGRIAKTFGVPTGKGGSITRKIDGEEVVLTRGVSASRWTFVIGRDGKVLYKNSSVKAASDAEMILTLDALTK